tara:strand:+ start:18315 stop:19154 length:840 start_codon:yes stop_codon:yes gene_type:complete
LESIDILTIGNITEDKIFKEGKSFSSVGGPSFYASRACIRYGVKVGIISASNDEFNLNDHLSGAIIFPQNRKSHTIFENHYNDDLRIQKVIESPKNLDVKDFNYPRNYPPPKLVFYCPVLDEIPDEFLNLFPGSIRVGNLQGWMRKLDSKGNVSIKRKIPDLDFSIFDVVIMSECDMDYDKALEISETCKLVCITKGKEGSTLIVNSKVKNYKTIKVKNIDETGAGDVWAITFSIFHFIFEKNIDESAMFANTAASISIQGLSDSKIPTLNKLLNSKKW